MFADLARARHRAEQECTAGGRAVGQYEHAKDLLYICSSDSQYQRGGGMIKSTEQFPCVCCLIPSDVACQERGKGKLGTTRTLP